jgi:hypothetical protein
LALSSGHSSTKKQQIREGDRPFESPEILLKAALNKFYEIQSFQKSYMYFNPINSLS